MGITTADFCILHEKWVITCQERRWKEQLVLPHLSSQPINVCQNEPLVLFIDIKLMGCKLHQFAQANWHPAEVKPRDYFLYCHSILVVWTFLQIKRGFNNIIMECQNTKNERLLMDTWEFLVFSKFCEPMSGFAITGMSLYLFRAL